MPSPVYNEQYLFSLMKGEICGRNITGGLHKSCQIIFSIFLETGVLFCVQNDENKSTSLLQSATPMLYGLKTRKSSKTQPLETLRQQF